MQPHCCLLFKINPRYMHYSMTHDSTKSLLVQSHDTLEGPVTTTSTGAYSDVEVGEGGRK